MEDWAVISIFYLFATMGMAYYGITSYVQHKEKVVVLKHIETVVGTVFPVTLQLLHPEKNAESVFRDFRDFLETSHKRFNKES